MLPDVFVPAVCWLVMCSVCVHSALRVWGAYRVSVVDCLIDELIWLIVPNLVSGKVID